MARIGSFPFTSTRRREEADGAPPGFLPARRERGEGEREAYARLGWGLQDWACGPAPTTTIGGCGLIFESALGVPRGQKRILSLSVRSCTGCATDGWRGATWLETEAARFWLCAGAQREEGSGEDAYEIFAALHRAERLLPDDDDRPRDELERIATQATDGRFVEERLRDVLFGLVLDAAEAELWEPRAD